MKKRNRIKKQQKNKSNGLICFFLIIIVIALGASCYLFRQSVLKMASATQQAYQKTKAEESGKVYDDFFDAGKNFAEEQLHSSNRVYIQIGKIQEEEKLEVLRVSDVDYIIWDKEDKDNKYDITSWRKVPAMGVFTVNLKASEIIKDDERKYVLVRIPSPQLTDFTLDDENKETLFFHTGLFDNTPGDGADITAEQDKEAYRNLKKSMSTNSDYYQQSKDSAKTTIKNLVAQMNPDINGLIVDVEFIDEDD